MFRIVFDPKISKFIVQLNWLGLFWRTCMAVEGEPRTFATYPDAAKWVSDVGLCEVYECQRPPRERAAIYSPAAAR